MPDYTTTRVTAKTLKLLKRLRKADGVSNVRRLELFAEQSVKDLKK